MWFYSKTIVIFSVITLFVLSANAGVSKLRTGSYLSSCKQSDPKFQECVKHEMASAGHVLAKGIPDLAIPAIEPLIIPRIELQQGTKAINYKALLTNLKLYGLSSYKVDDLSVNLEAKKLDIKLTIPVLYLTSDYDIKGRALVVPIQGNGPFTANLTDVKVDARLKGKLVKRKGQEFLEIKDTSVVKLTVKTAKAHFGNLFNGDATLSRATNDFLNQNSKDIIDEVMPAIEQVTSTLIDDICNKAFKITPYDKLTPK